ncbi:MAG: gamma carbonic anhydrase family protein [Bacteroidetes bacterium]|jgi:carbonic anhydrase/acetyltransferase-like protein (isoleucine patch superfamily)|nr:gamma carbonic anhydrase family protein [Bacteroidota bacterium]
MKALLKSLRGHSPQVHPTAFVAETAVLIGQVQVGEGSSIWYNTVLRGDVNAIRVGARSNIQDGAVVHCTYQHTETHIGDEVTIGHLAMIHGCTIHSHVLVGMSCTVLDQAVIEPDVILGAGSLVLQRQVLESGHLYAGSPARKLRKLSEEQMKSIRHYATQYQMYTDWYLSEPNIGS